MACPQSQFCTKDFFRATNFLTKNTPKISPKFLRLCSVGQKKSRKIPSKFPTQFSKFPCEKSKKIHRRASAGAQGEQFRVSETRSQRPLRAPERLSVGSGRLFRGLGEVCPFSTEQGKKVGHSEALREVPTLGLLPSGHR